MKQDLKQQQQILKARINRPASLFFLAFLCGAGASLALPPTGWLPAALLLAMPIVLAVGAARPLTGALLFGAGGLGWFVCSLYWIASALFVKGGIQLLVVPLACLGLPVLLSLFWIVAAYLALKLPLHSGAKLVALAGFWGGAEWLRSFIFTGFPWNVTGHIFAENLLLAQMAAFTGQHGLNVLAGIFILVAAALYLREMRAAIGMSLPLCLLIGGAAMRLADMPPLAHQQNEKTTIRLVQPNIPQTEKWDRSRKPAHIKSMTKLALQPATPAVLTILPEAAIAGFWRDDADSVRRLARAITPKDGVLLTGILSSDDKNNFLNSAVFLHHSGGLLGQYHKQHLVPFGEYIPFRDLPFVSAISGQGEFTPGPPVEDIYIEPFGYIRVLICYEIIFPGFIARDRRRPDMLITLSNDAWFGQTVGPHQHFAQSRLRAIEEGLPVYRLANTGVSGGFDGFGRLLGKTKLGQQAVLDLPHVTAQNPTFYAENRFTGFSVLLIWLGILAIFLEFLKQKRNKGRDKI